MTAEQLTVSEGLLTEQTMANASAELNRVKVIIPKEKMDFIKNSGSRHDISYRICDVENLINYS
jgi:hypothetical protein